MVPASPNATHWLSGENMGVTAARVSGISTVVPVAILWMKSDVSPRRTPMNAIRLPSGAIAIEVPLIGM